MAIFVPKPDQYAPISDLKAPLYKDQTDGASDPVLRRFLRDATSFVRQETRRDWVLPLAPVTLTYDAVLSAVLRVDDMVSVDGVAVVQNGVILDPSLYAWRQRRIVGEFPHFFAVELLAGTWADDPNAANRSVRGDIQLTGALPCTTPVPPGPIAQCVVRVAAATYEQWRVAYQNTTTGADETGQGPMPQQVSDPNTDRVMGYFRHPRALLGRP